MGLNFCILFFLGMNGAASLHKKILDGSHSQLATECEFIIIAQYPDFPLGNHFASLCLRL